MKNEYKFTEELLYEEYKITARNDGRYSCSLPAYDIIDEAGKKHRKYVTIYGEDPNEVRLNRANYIKEKMEQQTLGAMSKELLITKMEDWFYHQKLHKIKPTSFDRLEQTYLYQIIPALDALGWKNLRLADVEKCHIEQIMDYNLYKGYSFSVLKKTYIHQPDRRKREILKNFEV